MATTPQPDAGDTVRVHIKNDCPLGGDTQMASFTVEEVALNRIVGTDPAWGDTCEISGFGTDTLEYSDGGKSGEVESVEIV
jgi:hypothetical protein